MRRELAARADSQYQQIDRAYADDPNARQDVLADASISDAIKELVRHGSRPDESAPRVLTALRQDLIGHANALAARLETGLKESFAASIAYLIWLGFWLIVASLVLTLFIPAIPLRDRSTTEERTRAAEV